MQTKRAKARHPDDLGSLRAYIYLILMFLMLEPFPLETEDEARGDAFETGGVVGVEHIAGRILHVEA